MKQLIDQVKERIEKACAACGRDPKSVRLVAVSKTKPAETMREAHGAGIQIFGENYIQESMEKTEQLKDIDATWHFIGHLQSKKAKYAVKLFDLIHSVDSLKLAGEINKHAAKIGKVQNILIQVNIADEASKSGADPEEVIDLVKEVSKLEHVSIKGLMAMPPYYNDPEKVRPFFAATRGIRDRIEDLGLEGVQMDELSMGMTGDFEVAIEEGSTFVRIGTAIFGAREYKNR